MNPIASPVKYMDEIVDMRKMKPLVLWVEKVKVFWNGGNRLVELIKINKRERQELSNDEWNRGKAKHL
jgi:hypothetical protein